MDIAFNVLYTIGAEQVLGAECHAGGFSSSRSSLWIVSYSGMQLYTRTSGYETPGGSVPFTGRTLLTAQAAGLSTAEVHKGHPCPTQLQYCDAYDMEVLWGLLFSVLLPGAAHLLRLCKMIAVKERRPLSLQGLQVSRSSGTSSTSRRRLRGYGIGTCATSMVCTRLVM